MVSISAPGTIYYNNAWMSDSLDILDTVTAGTLLSTPATTVDYYLSDEFTGQHLYSLGSRDVPSLNAGQSSTATTTVPLPFVHGIYRLTGHVNPSGVIAEETYSNNVKDDTLVISWPDYIMSTVSAASPAGVSYDTSQINQGGEIEFQYSVTAGYYNPDSPGTEAPPTTVAIYLVWDQTSILLASDDIPMFSIPHWWGGGATLTLPVGLTGHYSIQAIVDPANLVREYDETNNVFTGNQVTIYTPDLVMAAFSAPTKANSGTKITVSDTVTAGNGSPSPSYRVNYYLSSSPTVTTSGTYLGSRWVPGLAPGASSSASTTLQLPKVAAGNYYVGALADATQSIIESDKSNNARSTPISIK